MFLLLSEYIDATLVCNLSSFQQYETIEKAEKAIKTVQLIKKRCVKNFFKNSYKT